MFRHREKEPLDLSLNDSNYEPAPNPNMLAPQAATGQKQPQNFQQMVPHNIKPIQNMIQPDLQSRPLPPIQPIQNRIQPSLQSRPLPPTPPTIINNYYYVQSDGTSQKSPRVRPNESLSVPLKNYASRPVRPTISAGGRVGSSGSSSSSILSRPSDIYTFAPLKAMSESRKRPQRYGDLIGVLSTMNDDAISVHNPRLLALFEDFPSELIGALELSGVLISPETKRSFNIKACRILSRTFATKNSHGQLDFRGFVRLCAFVKGCWESFNYYDKDQSHTLEYREFLQALKRNGMSCPNELLSRIFESSSYVDIERFIMAVVIIRKYERDLDHAV